jgi:hypothetical protein
MAGFIGNPTHVSPYIAMIIPVCLYLQRRAMAGTMAVAVFLTTSQVAIGAMAISLVFFYLSCNIIQIKNLLINSPVRFIGYCIIGILLTVCVFTYVPFDDHERVTTWKAIIQDTVTPQLENCKATFPLTGLGMGTFKYVFHFQHENRFHQAHNDYLELAYNLGYIGLGLLCMAIFALFKEQLRHMTDFVKRGSLYKLRMSLLSSFVCVLIAAGGTFIFQIGTTVFYAVIVVGLLYNEVTL